MIYTRHNFTIIELLVSVVIIAILFSLLMPAFSESREKARFVRWLQFNKQCSTDPTCVINLNFQDEKGDVLKNSAQAYQADGFNAADYSGIVKGDYEWGSGRWRKNKSAVQFDGMSTYIEFPGAKHVAFEDSDNFTIIAWVKFDLPANARWSGILSKSYMRSNTDGYDVYIDGRKPTGNRVSRWAIVDSGITRAIFYNDSKAERKVVPVDNTNWFQLVIRNKEVNGNQEIQMFLNNIELRLRTTRSIARRTEKCAARLALGGIRYQRRRRGVLTEDGRMRFFFKGKMDELLVYSRALSDKEIKAHYLMGAVHGN